MSVKDDFCPKHEKIKRKLNAPRKTSQKIV